MPWNAKQISLPAHHTLPAPLVIDDLPEVVPVGAQELAVMEAYLGAIFNELLGPGE
jgi:hypothetical protein